MSKIKTEEEAVGLFLANPYWNAYYNEAPSKECKEWIRFEFTGSVNGGGKQFKNVEEFRAERDRLRAQLKLEDWKHLLKYSGNNPWRAICKQKIRELEEKQGGYKEK